MRGDASAPFYCGMAEISVRGTDRLHNAHECDNTSSSFLETQFQSDQQVN